ncbi:MAG: geranylgeranylglycerol-phosphate geranylgeranyltransferase [Bacteroidetes bacterium]|nr:geranylgeranylglycerol-phosphate geranylgeranyltransferase [Bacteroidota bacterium]
MKLIVAFLKLVRLPNLVFIALAQILFQYCIYSPLYKGQIPQSDTYHFIFLVLASVFIAAAGYILNDYFDINIDEVNKPKKMVVDKIISRRWAIVWHLALSSLGVICSFLAFPFLQKWYLIVANLFCIALLWFYSTNFKKQLLVGNIVISVLTGWTILVVFFSKVNFIDAFGGGNIVHDKLFKLAIQYTAFAFIISLVREAIKDLEDMHGDAAYQCKTMPIVWGVNVTKVYIAVWLTVLLALLFSVVVYVLQFQWWFAIIYVLAAVIVPLILVFSHLKSSRTQQDYHRLSNIVKLSMFTGVLSMIFFYFYL